MLQKMITNFYYIQKMIKKSRFYSTLLFLWLFQAILGQSAILPTDSAVRIGTLSNGLTYYLRYNNHPEKQANFYIAQKVGSKHQLLQCQGLL